MVSTLENQLKCEYKKMADLEAKLVIKRSSTRALQKAVDVQKPLENRLKRERKEKIDLEAKLVSSRSNIRA